MLQLYVFFVISLLLNNWLNYICWTEKRKTVQCWSVNLFVSPLWLTCGATQLWTTATSAALSGKPNWNECFATASFAVELYDAVKPVATAGLLRWTHHTVQVRLIKRKQAKSCTAASSPARSGGVASVQINRQRAQTDISPFGIRSDDPQPKLHLFI